MPSFRSRAHRAALRRFAAWAYAPGAGPLARAARTAAGGPAPSEAHVKIACVGDSITYGHHLEASDTYPARLQAALGAGVRVGNFGRSGATLSTAGDLPYEETPEFRASMHFGAALSIIMLGTNDAKPFNWHRALRFDDDAAALIAGYQRAGARVCLALPPPAFGENTFAIDPHLLASEVVPRLREAAGASGAQVLDVFGALRGEAASFPDGVHPSAHGARHIALAVQQGLAGALPRR